MEGAQLCLGKLLQLLGSSNVLLKQLICFLLQFAHKHLPGILSPVGDKRPGEVRYHTTHHSACKAAWKVLLEGSRCCCCYTLCSIHCFVTDPVYDRFKVSVYYKGRQQLFLDIGESTARVLGKFGPLCMATVESVSVQQILARVGV